MVNLLLKNKADVNLVNATGDSALHHAVFLQRKDIVKILITAGANPAIKNKENKTAEMKAIETQQPDIAEYLKNARSNNFNIFVEIAFSILNCWL